MDEFEAVKQMFAGLTDEQRKEIVGDYCRGCWIYLGMDGVCHCQNDE